jgi:cytochrome P450
MAFVQGEHGIDKSVILVTSWLNRATLDIIGIAVLGYELDALTTHSPLSNAYNTMFDLTPMGNVIAAINAIVPVRSWLPLKANVDFVQARNTVRRLIRQHIRRRKQEVSDEKQFPDKQSDHVDLLSLILREESLGNAQWTEDDILGNVSNDGPWILHCPRSSYFEDSERWLTTETVDELHGCW